MKTRKEKMDKQVVRIHNLSWLPPRLETGTAWKNFPIWYVDLGCAGGYGLGVGVHVYCQRTLC